ncbi:unnamed protein product [Rotaria socialis]
MNVQTNDEINDLRCYFKSGIEACKESIRNDSSNDTIERSFIELTKLVNNVLTKITFAFENMKIREFAKLHITDENYDLLNFIAKQQLLVSFNEPEHKKLQIVFEKIYTILNRLSRGEHQHRLNPNDHVRVLYDDAQFYGVILDIFNSKTNKWRTVFDRREYAFEWVMVHRIFKR